MLDSRLRGCQFKPYLTDFRQSDVFLSMTLDSAWTCMVQPRKMFPEMTEILLTWM